MARLLTRRNHVDLDSTPTPPAEPRDTTPSFEHSKQPVSRYAGRYGHPFHPILVTVPIGAWFTSFVFDLVTKIDTGGSAPLFSAAKWAIGVGLVGAVVAAVFGILDLSTIPRRTPAYRVAASHLVLNVVVFTMFVIDWFARVGEHRSVVGNGELLLSLAALVILGASGWLGGTLVFRFGVRVADEDTQRAAFDRRSDHV